FVYNLARSHQLRGEVINHSSGVDIIVEGQSQSLQHFHRELSTQAPPLAVITTMEIKDIAPQGFETFSIRPSNRSDPAQTLISPDIALCPDCLRELFDPGDRRFHYPFINCTNCGPRYTIIESIPYDRPYTAMRHFTMCPQCQAEYDDPANRRFHAQPNACPECGPRIWLVKSNGDGIPVEDLIARSADLLHDGKILALKGLGGFHLAVDACDEAAVARLRERKHREAKPLAVMFPDIDTARQYVTILPPEAEMLMGPRSPIMLCKVSGPASVVPSIATGYARLGVMLPYTPLHHLLLREFGRPLVMTSANLSEEPICIDNDEALSRLQSVADYFLLHNRHIYTRSDDAVYLYTAGAPRPIRRGRGFAPQPIFLQTESPSILAVGGEFKNTICLTRETQAFVSQHLGDMENLETFDFFKETINHLQKTLEIKPTLIVHDRHPDYLSTRWAKEQKHLPRLAVPHHHAHLAACMAEHKLTRPVIGIILDGTGLGKDDNIWGGEILTGDYGEIQRFAHLENMLLPGGDAAIKAPWRIALAYLAQSFNDECPRLPFLDNREMITILDMIRTRTNSPLTSSMGRLFDAVSAMAGGPCCIRYEGEAAIALTQACDDLSVPPFTMGIRRSGRERILCVQPLIRDIAQAIQEGADFTNISNRFHRTLVDWLNRAVQMAHRETGLDSVVLSGGVFQNEILLENLLSAIAKQGLKVYAHEQVPTNDGGLALGQAAIGQHYLKTIHQQQE
ncbi:MAG: carbamoyltransferase HypF, partial [Candidatus Marinimicrobia bacterium]|nr:carbamoyltransferase HypF [Candidatus Neomarinimicrobiota bacterium]